MSEIHPAARGFALASELYERSRPDYPQAALDFVAERLGLGPGRDVLDLAAGTGKLTRQLVATGARAVAVDPIPAMLDRLRAEVPGVTALEGTAEAIPLGDASVDAVTVAQAFHWFDHDRALAEMHRVLRPGGGVALVWNTRDEEDGIQRALIETVAEYELGTPRRGGVDAEGVLGGSALFDRVEAAGFPHRQEVDEEGLVGRVLSISFVAAAPDEVRAEIEARVRDLARGLPRPIVLPYRTEVYVGFAV